MGGDERTDSRSETYPGGLGRLSDVHILKMPEHVQQMENVHVWGIDPGTRRSGLAVLRPGEGHSFSTTLGATSRDGPPWYMRGAKMTQVLRTYLTCITPRDYGGHLVVGLELPGVYRNTGITPVQLGDIRGLFMGMLVCEYMEQLGDRLHLYPSIRPTSIKLMLAGDGGASKAQVLQAVYEDYSKDIVSFDEADSIGVALLALEQFRKDQRE